MESSAGMDAPLGKVVGFGGGVVFENVAGLERLRRRQANVSR